MLIRYRKTIFVSLFKSDKQRKVSKMISAVKEEKNLIISAGNIERPGEIHTISTYKNTSVKGEVFSIGLGFTLVTSRAITENSNSDGIQIN